MKTIIVKCTLNHEAAGMTPGNPDTHAKFLEFRKTKIKKMTADIEEHMEDEKKAIKLRLEQQKADQMEDGLSVFPRDPATGKPAFTAKQMCGFFKDAILALKETKVKPFDNFKKQPRQWVDRHVFVTPRWIPIEIPEGSEMGIYERPITIDAFPKTITTIKVSETVPAGSVIKFAIQLNDEDDEKYVLKCLEYGWKHGFGQDRNGSWLGTFNFDVYDQKKKKWVAHESEFEQEAAVELPEG